MGRDHVAPQALQSLKKKGKPGKTIGANGANGLALQPSSPISAPSTAASTPQIGAKSPMNSFGMESLELGSFSLDGGKQEQHTCTVCNGQIQTSMSDETKLYACENPHHSHRFLTCSVRCAKKFENPPPRKEDAKRKQTSSGKHTDRLTCPSCRYAITNHQSNERASPDANETKDVPASPVARPNAKMEAIVPMELLPPTKRRSSGGKPQEHVQSVDEESPMARRTKKQVMTIAEPEEESPEEGVDESEMDEARSVVASVNAEVAELEKSLLDLAGKAHRKERNETNNRIFTLKNSPSMMAAQRLLKDPIAERRRRIAESKTIELEAARHVQEQDLARARLAKALENKQDGAESWAMLLREGRAMGLTEDDEVMAKVGARLKTLQDEERLRQEESMFATAVQSYVNALSMNAARNLIAREREEKKKQQAYERAARQAERHASYPQYKTDMCRSFAAGSCRFGDACSYAHGVEELRAKVAKPAHQNWQKGRLPQGDAERRARAPRKNGFDHGNRYGFDKHFARGNGYNYSNRREGAYGRRQNRNGDGQAYEGKYSVKRNGAQGPAEMEADAGAEHRWDQQSNVANYFWDEPKNTQDCFWDEQAGRTDFPWDEPTTASECLWAEPADAVEFLWDEPTKEAELPWAVAEEAQQHWDDRAPVTDNWDSDV